MSENQSNSNDFGSNIGPTNPTLSILLISILCLFLEMMLIRWIATEIRIFAYLQNTILVVCFLGLGLGCFTSHHKINVRSIILPLLAITLILAIPLSRQSLRNISELLSVIRDIPIFYHGIVNNTLLAFFYVILGLSLTFFFMLLILDIFVPIGRILGRLLDQHPNTIWAYSVNIFGGLIGTWLFVLLSSLYAPPMVWCSAVVLLVSFFLNQKSRTCIINLVLCAGILIFSWFAGREPGSIEVTWSPYQKLVLREIEPNKGEFRRYKIDVNNTRYQEISDLTPHTGNAEYSYRDIQLLLHPNPGKILILGSATGNDVTVALQHGIKEITAVEIDPAIISMGRRYHLQKPYDSPAVRIVNDDARSFFATCRDRFDIILFAFLDSHTSSVMTNTRLDEYVYTRESMKSARSLLEEGGIIVLHFGAQEYFIADRLANVIRDIFNQEPMSFLTPFGVMFVAGNLVGAREQIEKEPNLKGELFKWQPFKFTYTTPISTDDWPYLYLQKPSIPLLYYLLAGILVLVFVRSCWRWKVSGLFVRWNHSHWHFFFLGAAFMLLEVQNISKAAAVFGSTWLVNAIIVSGVLFMILLANMITAKFQKLSILPIYFILCAICLLLYYIDLAEFAFLPYLLKAILIGSLTSLPMVFSGIIFIRSFTNFGKKDQALGANLLGALAGALLQSVTFITGIKALLLIVMGFYVLSCLTLPSFLAQNNTISEA